LFCALLKKGCFLHLIHDLRSCKASSIAAAARRPSRRGPAAPALPSAPVTGSEPLVDDPSVWDSFLAVPEESGAHVVLLGGDRLLMAADAPRSAELFRSRGYEVVEVDISEYEKLEGCVTCLSVRAPTLMKMVILLMMLLMLASLLARRHGTQKLNRVPSEPLGNRYRKQLLLLDWARALLNQQLIHTRRPVKRTCVRV